MNVFLFFKIIVPPRRISNVTSFQIMSHATYDINTARYVGLPGVTIPPEINQQVLLL